MTEPQDLRPVASFTDDRGEERWVSVNSTTETEAWVEHVGGTTEVVALDRLHHESGPPIRPAATFTHEITQRMGEPAEAKIFRNGVLVFSGVDRSALTAVAQCPHVLTSDEGTSYCTLAESGARAAAEDAEPWCADCRTSQHDMERAGAPDWRNARCVRHGQWAQALPHEPLLGSATMTEDGLWAHFKARAAEQGLPVTEAQRDEVLAFAHEVYPGRIRPGEEREMGFAETLHHLGVEGLLQRDPHPYGDLVRALRVQSQSDSLSHRAADAIDVLAARVPAVGDTVSFRWGSGRQEGKVDSQPSVHVDVGNGYGMTVPVRECSIRLPREQAMLDEVTADHAQAWQAEHGGGFRP